MLTTMRGFLFTDSVLVDYNVFSVEKKFIHCNKLRITIIGILIVRRIGMTKPPVKLGVSKNS